MDYLLKLAVGLYTLLVIALSLRIIMRRRPVGITLAWMLLLYAIPLLGVIAYLTFGERFLGHIRARRGEKMRFFYSNWLRDNMAVHHGDLSLSSTQAVSLHRLTYQMQGLPVLDGNGWTLLDSADATLDALIEDINQARCSVLLEFYICQLGGRVDEVFDALRAAHRRGVAVRLMLDSVGSKEFLRSKACDALRSDGLEILEVLYASAFRMTFRRMDLRLHRKIVAIDNRISYTGSMNLVDPRHFKQDAGVGQWIDLMVRIEGPVSTMMQATSLLDWEMETGERLSSLLATNPMANTVSDGARMQILPSGPGSEDDDILMQLLSAIYGARQSVQITTPYFVPDDILVVALKTAALRGVTVRIFLPHKNDSRLAEYAGASFYEELLLSGVEIYRFHAGLLHTKCVLIDQQLTLIGTVNLDMRSLWLNFEISLLVDDPRFAAEIQQVLLDYQSRSRKLGLSAWRKRGAFRKVRENLAQLCSPLL